MGKHKALGCIAHSNLVIVRALRELHTDEPFPSFRGSVPKLAWGDQGLILIVEKAVLMVLLIVLVPLWYV